MYSKQRGNILFLILLAVVLFAALSYAVTSNERGQVKSASIETVEAKTAELLNYFALIDSAIQRMMLTGDVKDYELNFYYQNADRFVRGGNDNTNCTASRCRVFDPAGGAVTGKDVNTFTRNNFTSDLTVNYVSVPYTGTGADDIVISVMQADSQICRAVNAKFGVSDMLFNSNISAEDSTTVLYVSPIPVGPIPSSGKTINNVTPAAASAKTWCSCLMSTAALCESQSSRPVIYHVVVAR